MSGNLFERYGAIVDEDVEVLEACLESVAAEYVRARTWAAAIDRAIRVVEIGMHDGATARGIERYLLVRGLALDYTGVDPDDGSTRPRHVPKGGEVIGGDSAEVFDQVRGGIDLLWIDGCHCFNHVVLDFVHYAPKVRAGGFVCFHDVNRRGEGDGHQYHGPDVPKFARAVNAGLDALLPLMLAWGFAPFDRREPTDRVDCGTAAFRRERA